MSTSRFWRATPIYGFMGFDVTGVTFWRSKGDHESRPYEVL